MRKPIDWRAVCGKTARTVRREGRCKSLPYPYHGSTAARRLGHTASVLETLANITGFGNASADHLVERWIASLRQQETNGYPIDFPI
jgi:hypothetical protein